MQAVAICNSASSQTSGSVVQGVSRSGAAGLDLEHAVSRQNFSCTESSSCGSKHSETRTRFNNSESVWTIRLAPPTRADMIIIGALLSGQEIRMQEPKKDKSRRADASERHDDYVSPLRGLPEVPHEMLAESNQ